MLLSFQLKDGCKLKRLMISGVQILDRERDSKESFGSIKSETLPLESGLSFLLRVPSLWFQIMVVPLGKARAGQ